MTCIRVQLSERIEIELDVELTPSLLGASPLSLVSTPEQRLVDVAREMAASAVSAGRSIEREQAAVLHVLACARVADGRGAWDERTLPSLAAAFGTSRRLAGTVMLALATWCEPLLGTVLLLMADRHPERLPRVLGGAAFCTPRLTEKILRHVFVEAPASTRAEALRLTGEGKRLVPPGRLEFTYADEVKPVMEGLLREALDDESAKVRDRAIALLFGFGWTERAAPRLRELAFDPNMDVRQYALLALGTLRDAESLAILRDRLHHGEKSEVQSAIWALSRRPGGLDDVLSLLPDERPWVEDDVLGAVKNVAPPLSEAQLVVLRERVKAPSLTEILSHHAWRNEDPRAREVGPDDMVVTVVRRPDGAVGARGGDGSGA